MKVSRGWYARYHRKRKFLKRLILFSLAFFIVLILIAVVSFAAAWSLVHPDRVPTPVFHANIVPDHKEVTFFDSDYEVELKGRFFDIAGSGNNRVVIIAPGYKSNLFPFGKDTITLIKGIEGKGYSVFTFDFRNSGNSSGDTTTFGVLEKKDLEGAINYIESNVPDCRIAILGYSTGAADALSLAARLDSVRAVISDSSIGDMGLFIRHSLDSYTGLPEIPFNTVIGWMMEQITGSDISGFRPQDEFDKLRPKPVLFIHGEDDQIIPVKYARQLAAAYPEGQYWEVAGAGHQEAFLKNPEEYIKRVLTFLDQAFEVQDPV